MTVDERAQLVEDIKLSSTKRRQIAERAELDKEFDIQAAWAEVEERPEPPVAARQARRGTPCSGTGAGSWLPTRWVALEGNSGAFSFGCQ
jgi:hypothetical protein